MSAGGEAKGGWVVRLVAPGPRGLAACGLDPGPEDFLGGSWGPPRIEMLWFFYGFFKELDFKELEIHRYSLMDHQ